MAPDTRRTRAAGEIITLHYLGTRNAWAVYVKGSPMLVGYVASDNDGYTTVMDKGWERLRVCNNEHAALAFLVGYSAYARRERIWV